MNALIALMDAVTSPDRFSMTWIDGELVVEALPEPPASRQQLAIDVAPRATSIVLPQPLPASGGLHLMAA